MPQLHRTPYSPGQFPDDPKQLASALRNETAALKQGLESPSDFGEYKVLYAYPSRLRTGMVIYADGTTLNPGSGEGLYRYSLARTWVHLG